MGESEAQCGNQDSRLNCDSQRHLGLTATALREPNGDFGELITCLRAGVVDLDLECIAVGPDAVEIKSPEDAGAEALETSGVVARAAAEPGPCIQAPQPAYDPACQRPALNGTAWNITRAEHHICVDLKEAGKIARPMGKIAVHLSNPRITGRQGPLETLNVRGSKPTLSGAVMDVHTGLRHGQLVGHLAGPVGGTVVDHQEFEVGIEGQDLRRQQGKVVALVVSRNDDERATRPGHARVNAPARPSLRLQMILTSHVRRKPNNRSMSQPPGREDVSVVVPVYNSESTLAELVGRLERSLGERLREVVLVDDGSRDSSWQRIAELAATYDRVRGIHLMRNFGQHNATLTGIRAVSGEYVVTIDDDLQCPPEEVPRLLDALGAGHDVVYGLPEHPQHDVWRRLGSWAVKRALQVAMGVPGVNETSSFRAFATRLRPGFEHYDGPFVSIDVLLSWTTSGFTIVRVDHRERAAGSSQYTLGKLVAHAITMVTGFTGWPLRIASALGFLLTIVGALLLLFVLGRYAITGGRIVPGFSFLASVVVTFAGAELFALGIIGEYLARMHFRSMGRPQAVIRETVGAGARERERV